MKVDITTTLVEEHRLILRMIALLEKNAPQTAEGKYLNWQFYLDGIEFIRQYADRFHHAKEEDVLFKALVDNGMPKENSPVAAMLMEHDQGRNFVRAMESAVHEAQAGRTDTYQAIADNALGYAALLRDHISKEDEILYPLAERVIPETMRTSILQEYQSAEAQVSPGFESRYQAVVTQYEQE
ncbi:MAG: cation-binding protein [Geobacteraceae bacterium]|nr:cation-binding protein [Geobacteraceae bacterium]NTW79246.1 cation-binding protein [Geobacteraceae bacterium]